MKKLESILLIDDSMSTNLGNRALFLNMNLTEHVEIKENGKEALDYIKSEGTYKTEKSIYPRPDLIIVDINMPVMNGFEFLEEYRKISPKYKKDNGAVVSMLTQDFSIGGCDLSKDKLKANDFLAKPLNEDSIIDIWDKFID